MAQQGSYGENGESGGELKKKAKDCLDIAISQLTAADKDVSLLSGGSLSSTLWCLCS